MPPSRVSPDVPSWAEVRRHIREMDAAFDDQDLTPLVLAKGFAGLAEAMCAAMEADGATSSRFRAVVKALDLKTPKGALQRFLSAS